MFAGMCWAGNCSLFPPGTYSTGSGRLQCKWAVDHLDRVGGRMEWSARVSGSLKLHHHHDGDIVRRAYRILFGELTKPGARALGVTPPGNGCTVLGRCKWLHSAGAVHLCSQPLLLGFMPGHSLTTADPTHVSIRFCISASLPACTLSPVHLCI